MHTFIKVFVVCLALHTGIYSQELEIDQKQVQKQEKSNITKLVRALAKTAHDHPIMVAWMLFDYYEHHKKGTFPNFLSAVCTVFMATDFAHNMVHEYGVEHECQR